MEYLQLIGMAQPIISFNFLPLSSSVSSMCDLTAYLTLTGKRAKQKVVRRKTHDRIMKMILIDFICGRLGSVGDVGCYCLDNFGLTIRNQVSLTITCISFLFFVSGISPIESNLTFKIFMYMKAYSVIALKFKIIIHSNNINLNMIIVICVYFTEKITGRLVYTGVVLLSTSCCSCWKVLFWVCRFSCIFLC